MIFIDNISYCAIIQLISMFEYIEIYFLFVLQAILF